MNRRLLRTFDPLHDRRWKLTGYALATIFFGRLTLWYWIEARWGKA